MTAKKSPETLLRKGPSKIRSMTGPEFAALEPFLKNISPERVKAARLVLVDGMTHQGAATVINLGWTRQAVADAVKAVWKKFEAFQQAKALGQADKAIPEGWERVALVAPRELIPEFYSQIAERAPGTKKPGTKSKASNKNEKP